MACHKPFLKWAGNKFRCIDRIRELLPPGKRLIEPFMGSGAVFLNLDYSRYVLAEKNTDLITLYRHLQTEKEDFIDYVKTFLVPENNYRERYDEFRVTFNCTEDTRLKSALFIYLNRHGYNGLCRYNGSGKFNVPFGRYKKTYVPEEELRYFYKRAQRARFINQDFRQTLMQVREGDVVYCDPPYVPLSVTAMFRDYSPGGFAQTEQLELVKMAEDLASRGITVVISNHDIEFTREAYANAEIHSFSVQRSISSNVMNRNRVQELLAVFR